MISVTEKIVSSLISKGVECSLVPGRDHISENVSFEPPCGLKSLAVMHTSEIGAFSYVVSGFASEVTIGRYCSMGEEVQIGRGAHPISWMSTSPFFYAYGGGMLNIGSDFPDANKYHAFRPGSPGPIAEKNSRTTPDLLRKTIIGHDVWVGHGSFIGQGVKVGTGAVVAGHSVVVKDVPEYAIVAGNPAEIKGFRFNAKQIAALLELQWWNYAPWQIIDVPFANIDDAIDKLKTILPNQEMYSPGWISIKNL